VNKKVQVPNAPVTPIEPEPKEKKEPGAEKEPGTTSEEKVQLELGNNETECNKEQDHEAVQKFREKFGYANNSNTNSS
jgi:hypothetical protein